MKVFVHYLKDYFRKIPRRNFLLTVAFVALLVFLNYTMGIESRIRNLSPWPLSLAAFFTFYLGVFSIAYRLQCIDPLQKKSFLILLLLAPLFFSLKMVHWDLSFLTSSRLTGPWNRYWLVLLQLPLKLLVMLGLLYCCWRMDRNGLHSSEKERNFYGLQITHFSARPYFQLLLLLVPAVALASTQHDFLHTYPKMKNISFLSGYTQPIWPWRIFYELSYGLDFVSIEVFFRGFLVLGFVRFAGYHAILPMAAFYCTIHFGKPVGECISSFFGGLALGVIALRSQTILGGLIVHLGLAWMMELGGWLGNTVLH